MDKNDKPSPLSPTRVAGRRRLPDVGSVEGTRPPSSSAIYPGRQNAGNPPTARLCRAPGCSFTGAEGRAIEALADCIIPPDPQTPGGKDSGSAIFIDRQLAGPYGRQDGLYVRPPFMKGTKSQGYQSEKTTGPRNIVTALGGSGWGMQGKVRWQGICRSVGSGQGYSPQGIGKAASSSSMGADGKAFLRSGDQGRPDGLLRRSDLWRQIATWSPGR